MWNALKLIHMWKERSTDLLIEPPFAVLWFEERLKQVSEEVEMMMTQFRLSEALKTIYSLIWDDFCSWYLEWVKPGYEQPLADNVYDFTVDYFTELMQMLHPFMPFITEEIWQTLHARLGLSGETIMLASYDCDHLLLQSGLQNDIDSNNTIEQEMTWLQSVIIAVRNIRGEMNISPAKAVSLIFAQGNQIDRDRAKKMEKWIVSLAKISDIRWLNLGETAPFSATQLVGPLEVLVPLAGFIDKEAESKRLNKEIEKIEKEIMRIEMKLSQSAFVDKAPKEVVELERSRLNDYGMAMNKLKAKRSEIESYLVRLRMCPRASWRPCPSEDQSAHAHGVHASGVGGVVLALRRHRAQCRPPPPGSRRRGARPYRHACQARRATLSGDAMASAATA